MHPTVLLCDVGLVEACFGPFGDSANLDTRQVPGLRRMYHRLRNHFGRTRRKSLVTWVLWNLVSVHLETALVLVHDGCLVCAKHAIGSEIILDAFDCTSR